MNIPPFSRKNLPLTRVATVTFPGAPHATASECEKRVAASVRDEPPRRTRAPEGLGTQHRAGTRAPIERHRVERDEGEGKIFGRVRASPSNARESGMKVMRDLPRAFGMSPPRFRLQTPGTPDPAREQWRDEAITFPPRPFDGAPPADHSASLGFDLLFDVIDDQTPNESGPMPMLLEEDSGTSSSDDGHDVHAVYVR